MHLWTIFEERQRGKKKEEILPFPPILPLLIYTGKQNWQVPSLSRYFGFDQEFATYTPEVEILFLGLYTKKGEAFIQTRKALALCFELIRGLDLEGEEFQSLLDRGWKMRCGNDLEGEEILFFVGT